MRHKRFTLLLLSSLWAQCSLAVTAQDLSLAIAERMANAPAEVLGFSSREISMAEEDRELYAVYHEYGLAPLWVDSQGAGDHARALLESIQDADQHGLLPEDYHLDKLQEAWDAKEPDELAKLDTLLTLSLLALVNDSSTGRIQPAIDHPEKFASAGERRSDPVEIVRNYRAAVNPAAYLDSLHPQHYYYQGLKSALPGYRELAARGG